MNDDDDVDDDDDDTSDTETILKQLQPTEQWATLFHHQVIEKEGKTKLDNYTIQQNETKNIDRLSYV